MLTKRKMSVEDENMKTLCSVLCYRIDLYFHDYKLAIEIDQNVHSDRNIHYEIKRQKAIEQALCHMFIRIDPGKEDFNIFKAINEIFRHIKESTRKILKMKYQ